jgi:glutamine---fructose-6-phosphate transaminase (isomerizing)
MGDTMGGIIGIVGETDVAPLLVESLTRLGDRRGGTCGLAILDEEMGIDLRKDVGAVEEVVVRFDMVSAPGELGIAYIQRATHRVLAPENADPHLSCDRSFAVVHNGIISNHKKIKKELRNRGNHFFFSDTNAEVIAHLMEEFYQPGLSVEQAFVGVLRCLEGSFAIAMVSTNEPRKIFCARQKSPLILGIDSGRKFVGSEINAFLPYARETVPLDDGQYAVLSSEAYSVKDIATGGERNTKLPRLDDEGLPLGRRSSDA